MSASAKLGGLVLLPAEEPVLASSAECFLVRVSGSVELARQVVFPAGLMGGMTFQQTRINVAKE